MTRTRNDPMYTLGRSDAATDRLIEQARVYEHITLRMLRAAGVCGGMKVLDVGSAAGDVAIAAAQVVGSGGRVVGVDVNERILATAHTRARQAGHANIEFFAGDARTLDLTNAFDAIVGRGWCRWDMADPAATVRKFVTHLLPGGIVAFQGVEMTLYDGLMPRTRRSPISSWNGDWRCSGVRGRTSALGWNCPARSRLPACRLWRRISIFRSGRGLTGFPVPATSHQQAGAAHRVLPNRYCATAWPGDAERTVAPGG